MADDGLSVRNIHKHVNDRHAARQSALDVIHSHTESNDRVLGHLYDMRLRTINWAWPFSRRGRHRYRLLNAACDRLYYESQALYQVAIDIIHKDAAYIDAFLSEQKKTPA